MINCTYLLKKVQQLYSKMTPHLLTNKICEDADRLGVSIRQQQVVINNTAEALGTCHGVSSTAVYKARES